MGNNLTMKIHYLKILHDLYLICLAHNFISTLKFKKNTLSRSLLKIVPFIGECFHNFMNLRISSWFLFFFLWLKHLLIVKMNRYAYAPLFCHLCFTTAEVATLVSRQNNKQTIFLCFYLYILLLAIKMKCMFFL